MNEQDKALTRGEIWALFHERREAIGDLVENRALQITKAHPPGSAEFAGALALETTEIILRVVFASPDAPDRPPSGRKPSPPSP